MHKAAHVPEVKTNTVSSIAKLLKQYPIIGVLNMKSLPAKTLQKMRGTLRDKVVMAMTKKRLIKLAIGKVKQEKKGIEALEKYMEGMPALLFTNDNPFALAKILKANKTMAPIKPGQIAPTDIWVKEGATPFSPGPIIGELGAIGIKAGIDAGKVKIMRESLVVEKGKEVTKKVADVLLRLGVEPVEIGLDLTAVYENGEIIDKAVLFVDEKEYLAKICQAHLDSVALAVEIGYACPDTIKAMLAVSDLRAKAVAKKAGITGDEN